LGWGWRGSLFSWAGLLVLGILIWLPQVKFHQKMEKSLDHHTKVNVWKSRLAWNICLFMGVQSLLYFTIIAWLPDMLVSRGFSPVEAGIILSIMQLIGLIGSFLAPVTAVRFKDQVGIVVAIGCMYLIGFSFLFSQIQWVNYLGLGIAGLGLGSSVSLAYTLIGLRTHHQVTTASLSGMVQSTGYYLAALGPLLFGIAFDIFHNWDFLIYLMLTCSVLFIYFGAKSGVAKVI